MSRQSQASLFDLGSSRLTHADEDLALICCLTEHVAHASLEGLGTVVSLPSAWPAWRAFRLAGAARVEEDGWYAARDQRRRQLLDDPGKDAKVCQRESYARETRRRTGRSKSHLGGPMNERRRRESRIAGCRA